MDGTYAPRILYGSAACPTLFVDEDEVFFLSGEFCGGSWMRRFHNTRDLAGYTFFLPAVDMNGRSLKQEIKYFHDDNPTQY